MKLKSQWGEQVNLKHPLPEYPRMQMVRSSFLNLNGAWEYQITEGRRLPDKDRWKDITVPFALGSHLSGSDEILLPGKSLWYRKQFAYMPSYLHTFLNFEAVDQECVVYVNGIEAGRHSGGYTPFGFDISSLIKYQNSLMVRVSDPSDQGQYAYGKQKLKHGGMWYTPTAGIWGTVWLEDIPDHAVHDVKITPDLDSRKVFFDLAGDFQQAHLIVSENGKVIHEGITNDMHYEMILDSVHPWSPDDPFLYDVYIETEDDLVRSYFGMRKFSSGYDAHGKKRFFLNNQPLFLTGVLDQGYSPDGMYTYPQDEAMVFEIQKMKEMGFNLLRKHVKVENRRWYYHCDRLGMLVMQDIPNGGEAYDKKSVLLLPNIGIREMNDIRNPHLGRAERDLQKKYYEELDDILNDLYNFVCICAWVPFNEGWGQFNSAEVTEYIRNYDTTRLIDSASGWHDQGAGDFHSRHNYFLHFRVPSDAEDRIILLSEFGGYSLLEGRHSQAEKLYGYKKFRDRMSLNDAVMDLYNRDVYDNISNGLSGCIFTQVSDVEDECNGILTADRRVVKINERRMRRMNEKCIRRMNK